MLTLIVPYYRNPRMLERQLQEWELYPPELQIVVVDDGSPEPAGEVLRKANVLLHERLRLFRIKVDIPWNRGGARNLGAHVAQTQWIVHIDIDHVLPAESAWRLLDFEAKEDAWYRFPRWRKGRADATRRKDRIPPEQEFGEIHPHVDSYLCTRELYWRVGGYDEDYSGCLGGGNPFLKQLTAAAELRILPADIHLHVYTRTEVSDASDLTLSRDSAEYTRRRRMKEMSGRTKPVNPLRFPWEREL